MTKRLDQYKTGERGSIVAVSGDSRFLSRAAAVGLTIGCEVEIIRNQKNRPILLYERDTVIAVGRKISEMVHMEAV
jgi:ferrous iron transport protein A